MDVKTIATRNGFKVEAWGKPFGKKGVMPVEKKPPQKSTLGDPKQHLPKKADKPSHAVPPLPKKPKVEAEKPKVKPYGNSANGKAGGIIKLLVAWAKNDRDPETRKVMKEILVATKKIVWDHLSEKKRAELEKL